MEQLINITDAVFLGHVGEVELGASALAGIYYLVTYMLGFGFSIGLQVMIACRNGEQNYAETGRTFFHVSADTSIDSSTASIVSSETTSATSVLTTDFSDSTSTSSFSSSSELSSTCVSSNTVSSFNTTVSK